MMFFIRLELLKCLVVNVCKIIAGIKCVDHCCISVTTTLLRRELFEQQQGFRTDFKVCEDYELWLRICAAHEVGFIETPVANKFGGHADQLSARYWGMDRFRVQSLVKLLADPGLGAERRRSAVLRLGCRLDFVLGRFRRPLP